MDETLLKDRLGFWLSLAGQEKPIKNDLFIQFMIYWLILDGYLSEMSESSSDQKKLTWLFKHTDTQLYICLSEHFLHDPDGKRGIKWFIEREGVQNMRPGAGESRTKIDTATNFKGIMNVIHQVRCNLFHGAKDRMSPEDEQVTRHALTLIQKPIRLWLLFAHNN